MEIQAFNNILFRYGYQYNSNRNSIKAISPIKNSDFYNKNSYSEIIAILKKLRKPLSDVFLTAICDAVKNDKELRMFIKKQMSEKIGFLSYHNNSCYKDCVLMSLFTRKNSLIKNTFFREISTDLQEKLYEIYVKIQNGENTACREGLDKILKTFKNYNFGKREMNDPSEFLFFLFSEMKFEPVKKDTVSYLTDFTKRKKLYERKILCGPIDTIHRDSIKNPSHPLKLEDALEKKELLTLDTPKDGYKFTISMEKIIFAPYLVFHISRKFLDEDGEEDIDFSNVFFSEEITINKTLSLHAIILYENKHYTALIKDDNDVWYFYDDMEDSLKQLGSYKFMLREYKTIAEKTGVLFFYS